MQGNQKANKLNEPKLKRFDEAI